jgi:MFS family permease
VVYLVLTAVSLVANFLHFASFGLYEDDWHYIAKDWLLPPGRWLADMWGPVRNFYIGRPVQEFLLWAFGYLGSAFHSVELLYVVAAFLHAASVLMFFRVLRLRYTATLAALAALLFAISPISTIRPYLGGTLWSAPGLMFLFAAILVYARPRYAAGSYFLAILGLLTYEPLFLVFFAAPFFRRGRKTWRRTAIHVAICSLILVAYLVVRRQASESRLMAASGEAPMQVAGRVLEFAVYNAFGSFQSYVYAVYIAARETSPESLVWGLLLALATVACLLRLPAAGIRRTARLASPRTRWWMARVLAPGFGMMLLGYALSYFSNTHRLFYPLAGRDTRFSLAAIVGSSLVVAGMLWYPLANCRRRWTRRLAGAGAAAFCLLLLLYSFVIQEDYRREWRHMRQLLTGIMQLTPDAGADTLLVIRRPWFDETPLFPTRARRPSINFQPQGLQVGFSRIFEDYPGPEVFVVYGDQWRSHLGLHADGKLYWTDPDFGGSQPDMSAPVERIILLVEQPDGTLKRVDAPFSVEGRQLIQARAPGTDWPSKWSGLRRSGLWPVVFPPSTF